MRQMLDYGRVSTGTRTSESGFRSFGTSSVPNPMTQIIRQQDSLRLTAMQADSLASMSRRYSYRVDSLWTPVARYVAALPTAYQKDQAFDRYLRARRQQVDMLTTYVKAVNELLTSEQKRRLPAQIVQYLDPRFLDLVRDGTGLYVTAGSSSPFFFAGGGQFIEFAR